MSVVSETSSIDLEDGTAQNPLASLPAVDEIAVKEYVLKELMLSYRDLDIK